jgi:hypothetical protein
MKRVRRTLIVAAAVACEAGILSASACAQTYATAGELRDDCAAVPTMLQGDRRAVSAAGGCLAYIDGARGLAEALDSAHKVRILCIPGRVTTVEIAAFYVRSIDRLPGSRADPAAPTLFRTLSTAFPCSA